MLIEPHATSPAGQPMVSSPGPGKYDIYARLKRRFNLYRDQHQNAYRKHLNAVESQTLKSSQETARLQEQFLNNNNTKPKQKASGGGTARANKRANNNADSNETKSSKFAKLTANSSATTAAKMATSPSTSQVDIKPKFIITTSANSSPLTQLSLTSSQAEIKREIMDNSCPVSTLEMVHIDTVQNILDTANPNGTAPFDNFTSDSLWKDILNGFDEAGNEDFIKDLLEDLNCSSDQFGQTTQNGAIKQQQVINNNSALNIINNTPVTSTYNRIQYLNTTSEQPAVSTYHPIQPRNASNPSMTINHRANVNILSTPNQTNMIPNNINCARNSAPNPMQHQGLLITQQSIMQNQQPNAQQLYQQPIQHQQQNILLQQPQQIQLRVPGTAVSNLTPLNGQQNLSIQLSIQVPQQPQSVSNQAPAGQAAIALKQMAQQVQQKTHQWVNNPSLPAQSVVQGTPASSQQVQLPKLAQMPAQPNQPQQQQQKMQNTYFVQQQQPQQQHVYWQTQPQQTQHQQHMMPQSQQTQSHPQQQQQISMLPQQPQQHQQFQPYWSQAQNQQMMNAQPTTQPQQQQSPPQQQQHYYNNYNNYY